MVGRDVIENTFAGLPIDMEYELRDFLLQSREQMESNCRANLKRCLSFEDFENRARTDVQGYNPVEDIHKLQISYWLHKQIYEAYEKGFNDFMKHIQHRDELYQKLFIIHYNKMRIDNIPLKTIGETIFTLVEHRYIGVAAALEIERNKKNK